MSDESSNAAPSPTRMIAIIAVIGLVITAALAWTAGRIDGNSERRLLQVQTRQAASVVSLAIIGLQAPLQTALDIAAATDGDTAQFARFMAPYTGPNALFAGASLWRTTGSVATMVTSTGTQSATSTQSAALVARAPASATFVVTGFSTANQQGIGYALANPKVSSYAVYAERPIPANRRVPVESSSAFADLHFATYLGPTTTLAQLQTTDVSPSQLPLSGTTARESIPFGDTTITLVTSPAGHLGGAIGAALPWIILGIGGLLTIVAAFVAGWLVRRRRAAEHNAQTIAELYERLDTLFGEQRTISETLQRALLPQRNPDIASLEIASRYVAGAQGLDVGGDWYSIIQLDANRFGFVVGDVSGRGVDAAAHMGRIRFTLRAYLIEGHPPNIALDLCSRQLDLDVDGHFATVLIGTGDLTTREITLSNAGHLNPVVLAAQQAQIVPTKVGPPLGIGRNPYEATTITMAPGAMLLAFTDGLVERRDEDLDLGIGRLVEAMTTSKQRAVDALLADVLSTMSSHTGSEDDIAILAFRWTDRDEPTSSVRPAAGGSVLGKSSEVPLGGPVPAHS